MFGFPTATLLDCHGRYAQNVAFFRGIVSCMAKSTQERLPICVASVGKASLREGVWLCTSEAAHKGSPFDPLSSKEVYFM
ncbi:hypothetical protein MC885_015446, partial [Smutsia gigantea]